MSSEQDVAILTGAWQPLATDLYMSHCTGDQTAIDTVVERFSTLVLTYAVQLYRPTEVAGALANIASEQTVAMTVPPSSTDYRVLKARSQTSRVLLDLLECVVQNHILAKSSKKTAATQAPAADDRSVEMAT
ncbi:hypothetical protein ACFL04_04905 [Patescibacteria group bacterium]